MKQRQSEKNGLIVKFVLSMGNTEHRPILIVIAGPNGSGKTSVTKRFLHHEWAEAILPDLEDEMQVTSVN